MALFLQPLTYKDACLFIQTHHRHHLPPQGWKWGIAVNNGTDVVGVITVGRPVARRSDDGLTLEVTRCCTDGTKNAPSKLYGAAWRAAKAMGFHRLITFTLSTESGTSLHGSGWRVLYQTPGKSWSVPSRPRQSKHPIGPKVKWEIADPKTSPRVDIEPEPQTPLTPTLKYLFGRTIADALTEEEHDR